ncbi:MAG: PEGA domain-containing protein [Candidatus Saccharibacteria bacterium]|nr:PEGA domain-containing protein [Candidatus Saccharibacteria bacterium]
MHQTPSRRKELARRTFVYALMTLTVIGLVIVLMLLMLGYRFDITKRSVHQTGLVQYDSLPRGAMVRVDGEAIRTTKTKSTVLPGERQFMMHLEGYEPWQKTLTIQPETVTYLDYARLVPTKRRVTTMTELGLVQSARFAPGGQWLVTVSGSVAAPIVSWTDVRDVKKPKYTTHPLPVAKLLGYDNPDTPHQFTIHEWDTGARFVLVKHQYQTADGPKLQWLRLDREKPEEMIDVTTLTGLALREATFAGTSGAVLYALQDSGELREINLSQATISVPLISQVRQFSLYGDQTIAFVSQRDAVTAAGIWKKGWKQPRMVRTLAANEANLPLTVRASHYFHKDTVAVAVGQTVTMYRGALGDSDEAMQLLLSKPRNFQFGRPVQALTIGDNGRFVVARDEAGMMSYDLERLSVSRQIALAPGEQMAWLDSFHLQRRATDGGLVMQEFDGANEHRLFDNVAFETAFSSDQRFMLAVTRKDNTFALQWLALTTEEE